MGVEITAITRCDGCGLEIDPDHAPTVFLLDRTRVAEDVFFHTYLCLARWATTKHPEDQAMRRIDLTSRVEQTAANAEEVRATQPDVAADFDDQSTAAAAKLGAFEVDAKRRDQVAEIISPTLNTLVEIQGGEV